MLAGPYTPSEIHHQCAAETRPGLNLSRPLSCQLRVLCVCVTSLFCVPTERNLHCARRRVDATVVIQRYARGWAARTLAAKLAAAWDEREAFAIMAEERDADVLLKTQQRELQRRLRPRSKGDFAKLHKELEVWHAAESAKIAAAQMDPAAAAAARIALLNKETRLLGTLERLRTAAATEARDEGLDRMLDGLAAPKVWPVGGFSKIEVFTPDNARALELISLHKALHGPATDTGARLETLRALQRQAAAYDCMLTRDLLVRSLPPLCLAVAGAITQPPCRRRFSTTMRRDERAMLPSIVYRGFGASDRALLCGSCAALRRTSPSARSTC